MKLSEVMRKGCEDTVQAFGAYIDPLPDGTLSACALGAAGLGLGLKPTQVSGVGILEALGIDIIKAPLTPPKGAPTMLPPTIFYVVGMLNDDYLWAREDIADYLESQGY